MIEMDGLDVGSPWGQYGPRHLTSGEHGHIYCTPRCIVTSVGREAPFAVPCANILNGGALAANNVDFQEFMVVPRFRHLRGGAPFSPLVYQVLKKLLAERGLSGGIGDEGGFAPDLESNGSALGLISEAVERSGYSLGDQIAFALDPAASSSTGTANMTSPARVEGSREDGRLLHGAVRPVSSTEHRGWPRGGRLGWVGHDHQEAGRQGAARWRRPLCNEPEDTRPRHHAKVSETPSS